MKQLKQKSQLNKTPVRKDSKPNKLTSIFDERPKTTSKYERYNEMLAFRQIPMCLAAQERLVKALLEWSDLPDSRNFDQFLDDRCIHEKTMYEWMNKYPAIAEAVEYVRTHIGIVRENGMADRKYDNKTYGFVQHHYSSTWRATRDEDFARRQQLANDAPEHTTLVVFDTLAEDLASVPQIATTDDDSVDCLATTIKAVKRLPGDESDQD